MSTVLRLTMALEGQEPRTEELDGDTMPIKIGRLSSSHLRFEDSSVSRIHALIEKGAVGKYHLTDLGSAAGTFVNGEKITRCDLNSGDEIQFGNVVGTFEILDAVAASSVAASAAATFQAPALSTASSVASEAAAVTFQAPSPTFQAPVPPTAPAEPPERYDEATVNVSHSAVAMASQDRPSFAVHSAESDSGIWDQVPDAPYETQEQETVVVHQSAVSGSGMIITPEGAQVEPFTLQGYYDDENNYIPGYYDGSGVYHLGYGYYDDHGAWNVAYGYYDPSGTWVETNAPDGAVAVAPKGPSEREFYTDVFFNDGGGDTLEVAMLWADQVLAVVSYKKPQTVLVGSSSNIDFPIEHPGIPSDEFPLVAWDGSSYSVTITPEMGGLVQQRHEQYSLQEAIAQNIASRGPEPGTFSIPMRSDTSARLDMGEVSFLIHFTDQPVWVGAPVGFDVALLPYLTMSAVAHLSFLFLSLTMPEDPNGLNLDSLQAQDRFVQLMITPEQEEEPEPEWMKDKGKDKKPAEKHKGKDGKAGKEDSKDVNKKMAVKGPQDSAALQIKKAKDTQVAMNSGALAAFQDQVASPFGGADESIGSDAIHALGGLKGESSGASRGFGGLGLAGAGRGGGGISEKGIGMANVGTSGLGGRGKGGSGYGKGVADVGEKRARVPRLIPGKPKVFGSLDKEIIRRVVRQHRNEIRYCYEKELQKNPKLAGTIKVKFTISGNGSVISALVSSSTIKNARIGPCMTSKIRRWTFPEPKGGGIVVVKYPFNFKS